MLCERDYCTPGAANRLKQWTSTSRPLMTELAMTPVTHGEDEITRCSCMTRCGQWLSHWITSVCSSHSREDLARGSRTSTTRTGTWLRCSSWLSDTPQLILSTDSTMLTLLASAAVTLLLIMLASLVAFMAIRRKMRSEAELSSLWWKIEYEELMEGNKGPSTINKSRIQSSRSLNKMSSEERTEYQVVMPVGGGGVFYQGRQVHLKKLRRDAKVIVTRDLQLEFKKVRSCHHDNLVRVIGACIDPPHVCVVSEFCAKGTLQDLLQNDSFKLDWDFRFSLLNDVIEGACFLHESSVRYHGHLTSKCCMIDSRFILKIGEYGLPRFTQHHLTTYSPGDLLWTSPELLRDELSSISSPIEALQRCDVFSFGIILQEVITRTGPYETEQDEQLDAETIILYVTERRTIPYRPLLTEPEGCKPQLISLTHECWAEAAESRPKFLHIKNKIRKLGVGHGNILDNLLQRMEQYALDLEKLVDERTGAFLEEKRKAEELLNQLLPKSVADKLKQGLGVDPESYDMVTVYFSDICGFTSLSSESTPLQIIDLLNDLYTLFDEIIEIYDVYKVETIGDAYMVASGLPLRNGDCHAREVARMALTLLQQVESFTIRHQPTRQLKLRIGIHSGPVVAGVVGLKMPRYCLFGDTVNTASRMESNGHPLKIHVSEATKTILDTFNTFQAELRGAVEMKGKGVQTTYWLVGEREDSND